MPNAPRRFDRAGYSVPAFAEVTGLSPEQVRAGIRNGEINTVPFANRGRIPRSEAPRIINLLGLEPPAAPVGRPHNQRTIEAAE